MPPFRTFITPISYSTPDEVPKPLRDTIRKLAVDGMEIAEIRKFFDLPAEWIQQFITEEPPKNIQ